MLGKLWLLIVHFYYSPSIIQTYLYSINVYRTAQYTAHSIFNVRTDVHNKQNVLLCFSTFNAYQNDLLFQQNPFNLRKRSQSSSTSPPQPPPTSNEHPPPPPDLNVSSIKAVSPLLKGLHSINQTSMITPSFQFEHVKQWLMMWTRVI